MSGVSSRYPIVVQGEASETDSDDEVYITSLSAPPPHRVPGEASETDSEGEPDRAKALVLERSLPPLVVVRPSAPAAGGRLSPAGGAGAGAGSLLQQKLQESNARLCRGVASLACQVYGGAGRDLASAAAHLNGSQAAVITASHSVRLILQDLKAVAETIDVITSCHLLPDIDAGSVGLGR